MRTFRLIGAVIRAKGRRFKWIFFLNYFLFLLQFFFLSFITFASSFLHSNFLTKLNITYLSIVGVFLRKVVQQSFYILHLVVSRITAIIRFLIDWTLTHLLSFHFIPKIYTDRLKNAREKERSQMKGERNNRHERGKMR